MNLLNVDHRFIVFQKENTFCGFAENDVAHFAYTCCGCTLGMMRRWIAVTIRRTARLTNIPREL